MKLFKMEVKKCHADYSGRGTNKGFVVIAENENQAREKANSADSHKKINNLWLSSRYTSCTEVDMNCAQIVMNDYWNL